MQKKEMIILKIKLYFTLILYSYASIINSISQEHKKFVDRQNIISSACLSLYNINRNCKFINSVLITKVC
ncbi:MAG: hypothetical protein K2N61_09115, partial [Lachnospiraceae bacterium]|nr:hypothetical protein [Lachnospiraceae bacterium]